MSAPDETEIEASRAPLLDHLTELRTRLIVSVVSLFVGFAVCFAFAQQILEILIHPWDVASSLVALQKGGKHANPIDLLMALSPFSTTVAPDATPVKLIFTAPLELFFAKIKLAGFGAIALMFPVLAYQVYRFVAPGLYKRERKAFLPFLLASPLLFMLGAALVYFVMLPFVLWFSLSQQFVGGNIPVESMPKVSEYLSLVTTLIMGFGLCFQLPVVLTLLGLVGIINSGLLISGRRYAILGIAILAAVVTPPDPISMLMLIVPLVMLYEVSIWCVKLIEVRRRKDEEAEAREIAAT